MPEMWDAARAGQRMTRTMRTQLTSASLLVVLMACAPTREAIYDDVRRQLADRAALNVDVRQLSLETRELDANVLGVLSENLTLDAAVKVSLLNNRNLQATFERLGVPHAALLQASLPQNPMIDAELRFEMDGDGKTLEIGLVQDVLDFIAIPARRQAATANLEHERLKLVSTVISHVTDVRVAFYRVQANQQSIRLLREVRDGSQASFELAKRLHEAGNISDLEVAQHQALYAQSRLDLAAVETMVVQDRERLTALMGLWGKQVAWQVDPNLPALPASLDLDEFEAGAIKKSLDLEEIRWSIRAANAELGVARLEGWLPELGVGVSAERESSGTTRVGPALMVSIPIFNWNQGKIAARSAELRAAQHRYAGLAVEIRATARAVRNALISARKRADFIQETILPLRQKILDEMLLRYNAMLVGTFELVRAKRDQTLAQRQQVEALRDYWITRAEAELILQGRVRTRATSLAMQNSSSQDPRSSKPSHD